MLASRLPLVLSEDCLRNLSSLDADTTRITTTRMLSSRLFVSLEQVFIAWKVCSACKLILRFRTSLTHLDFSAHSNYTELALKELGVDAFPHVGKATELDVKGKKVFPVVTGTFGMTDFLHSVVGELGDKVAQSEVEDMESKLDSASAEDDKNDEKSILKEILDKISGLLNPTSSGLR